MLTREQKKNIEDVCQDYYRSLNPTHNIWHLKQTVKLAVHIANKEKADIETCKYGAMLHQFHDADKVSKILENIDVDTRTKQKLVHIVYCGSSKTIDKAKTKEARIVNDADAIQCLGAVGIMRQIHDFSRKWGLKKALQEGLKEQNLFYHQMKTKTAKKIAKEKYNEGLKFYKEVLKAV